MNSSTTMRWVLSVAAVAAVLWVSTRQTFFGDSISSVFLSVALFSIFLILVRTRFSWAEIAGVAGLAAAIYALLVRCGARRWLAALACVPVLFDPLQLDLEQYILTDVSATFLLVVALTAARTCAVGMSSTTTAAAVTCDGASRDSACIVAALVRCCR